MKRLILSLLAVCLSVGVSAKIVLPKVLGSNMVLQQNSDVNLWGKADANAKVAITLSWDKAKIQTTADKEGRWAVKVATPKGSFEPQTITISDGEKVVLENVLIGDVWVTSGQSNMEMPVKGFGRQPVEHSYDYILSAAKDANRIRMFTVKKDRSYDKDMEDCAGGEWYCSSPESVAEMSATSYFFAAALKDAVDFPIGLITANWGGTRVESWMPLKALKEVVTPEQYEKKQTIHNFTAKGFLWYQGCSNLSDNDHYDVMMARMVKQWREDWGDTENKMPFYYVMITPYSYGNSRAISYPRFVECQIRALKLIPNSGMAGSTDIGEEYCIHPAQKKEVGQRLAALAMAQTYGMKGFEPKAPLLESHSFADGKAKVKLSNCQMGLSPWYGEPVTGFEIAGADKIFHKAQASITAGNEVTVWSAEVKEPVAVRYSFRNFAPGNLTNLFGVPAVPFRTDNWNDVQ